MKKLKDMEKILIIRLSAIGDTIHTLPLAAALKRFNNNVQIGWVVEDKAEQFITNNPLVDDVFVIPKKKWKQRGLNFKNFLDFVKIIDSIQKKQYDIAIDTQQLLKSGIILGLSNAKQKLTYRDARECSQIFGNKIITPKHKLLCPNSHVIERHLDMAKYLGAMCDETYFILPTPKDKSIENVEELLSPLDKFKPTLTLAPATTWVTKHWDEDNWSELVEVFSNKCNVIITGSNADLDLVNRILDKANFEKVLNLAGKTNLEELSLVFKKSDMVISPDSGSANIAWAVQSPFVLTIFTSTSKHRTGPYGKNTLNLQGTLDCQPCHKKYCARSLECTKIPTVDEIVNIVNDTLHI